MKIFPFVAAAVFLSGCSKEPLSASAQPAEDVRSLGSVVVDETPREFNAAKVMPGPEQLTLADGRTFNNWRITNESSDSVYIKHSEGMAKVQKRVLPDSLRSEYPIDAELARQERDRDARQMLIQNNRPPTPQNLPAAAQSAAIQPLSTTELSDQMMQAIRDKAHERAKNFFTYEFKPTGTSRILAFDVSIAPEEPEPWAGFPGRYTVEGTGYLQFHQRYRGSERATREFRVYLDVTGRSVNVARFELL